MMFKIAGCVLVIVSSAVMSSGRVMKYYFTGRMMGEITVVCQRILYEKNTNLTYCEIFARMDFDPLSFVNRYSKNRYVDDVYKEDIECFLDNLGRRDSDGEEKYIVSSMKRFEQIRENCRIEYRNICRVYPMIGLSIGMFVVIFLF